MPRVQLETGFADLVFHVLAHVDVGALPGNLFSPPYIEWAAERIGPASERELGRDAALLAPLVRGDMQSWVAIQPVARLFDDRAAAERVGSRALAELNAEEVVEPAWLPGLQRSAAAELLWCASLLEARHHAALQPPAAAALLSLQRALAAIEVLSPRLASASVHVCRALTRNGRAFGQRVYVGLPDAELGVEADRVAMQAAHEAAVIEATSGARELGLAPTERGLEAIALVVLSARAHEHGLSTLYAAWLAQWGVAEKHCELAALPPEQQALARELLKR